MENVSDEDFAGDGRHPVHAMGNEKDLARPPSSNLFTTIISSGVNALRAVAPQIIPLLVFALLIPLIVAVSILAGWLVWKNASVSWEAPLYLQYGDGPQPYSQILLPPLVPQQRYDISVQLVVPVTESNLVLGNFMTSLTLSTPANKTLISIRRPAIILPPTRSFFSSKPSVITLDVSLLKAYLPGTSKVIATFELGRKDSWTSLGKGEGKEVSVLQAHIRGAIMYHGIRGLVALFPLTSALLSSIGFLAMLSVTLSVCILPNVLRRHGRVESIAEPPGDRSMNDEQSTTSDEGSLSRDIKSLRRDRSSSRHEDVKVEDETEPTPLLRRRASRRPEEQSDTDS